MENMHTDVGGVKGYYRRKRTVLAMYNTSLASKSKCNSISKLLA